MYVPTELSFTITAHTTTVNLSCAVLFGFLFSFLRLIYTVCAYSIPLNVKKFTLSLNRYIAGQINLSEELNVPSQYVVGYHPTAEILFFEDEKYLNLRPVELARLFIETFRW